MKTFNLDGYDYQAEDCIQGILVNPLLPDNFWTEPLVDRSDDEMGRWEEFPFILMEWEGMKKVYILDGGAWDRPTLRFASNDFNEVMKYLHDNNYIQFQDSQLTH